MSMKTNFTTKKPGQTGSALMLTMIMSAIALAILAGVMTWGATSARLTHRSIQYTRSTAAAEAATEKVVSQLTQDFLSGGESLVVNNLNSYRQNTVPSPADSTYWNKWEFNDGNGNTGQTYVQRTNANSYVVLDSTYAGLQGYVSAYTVVSHARDTASVQDVTAGVLQELQLVGIPIFQFYLFSSGDMEISCGQPFVGTGRVYSNGHLYIEPDNLMTFESSVSAVLDVLYQRDTADGDTRGTPAGLPAVFPTGQPTFPHTALTLPIGTANTPTAIREIIEPTPPGEDPNLPISKLRYNNRCDMVLTISNSGVSATSGGFNNFLTHIPTNELALFVSTNNSFADNHSFVDNREGKTVQPIDINIGNLTAWSQTNTSLRYSIGGSNLILSSIYVVDARTPPTLPAGNLGAVRVFNGLTLPINGLTVATGRPLYVWGDYNDDPSKLGTSDTSMTHPASLVADAITFLSNAWHDNPAAGPGTTPPTASDTTVNAALLTGVVETTLGHYSGGMENFPRFLESWGLANVSTYNGSMMKMFPSQYATGVWGQANVYDPPARNWTYDTNFNNSLKLPPLTPQFQQVKRHQWATVAPGSNVAAVIP
jgi:hypothetical protein